eukprot:scaffold20495_cov66-Phaeocystis_antarctica.AAC.1
MAVMAEQPRNANPSIAVRAAEKATLDSEVQPLQVPSLMVVRAAGKDISVRDSIPLKALLPMWLMVSGRINFFRLVQS